MVPVVLVALVAVVAVIACATGASARRSSPGGRTGVGFLIVVALAATRPGRRPPGVLSRVCVP